MHHLLPIKYTALTEGSSTNWESPHVKAHLLYQAHFSQMQVPVDYATDQRSILDSCIRILQVINDY